MLCAISIQNLYLKFHLYYYSWHKGISNIVHQLSIFVIVIPLQNFTYYSELCAIHIYILLPSQASHITLVHQVSIFLIVVPLLHGKYHKLVIVVPHNHYVLT